MTTKARRRARAANVSLDHRHGDDTPERRRAGLPLQPIFDRVVADLGWLPRCAHLPMTTPQQAGQAVTRRPGGSQRG